jgi:P27 family predicted phage terminase small subunit
VSEELKALDRLDAADRAIMTLHCQTWATWASVTKHVIKFGAVIKWPNGVPGPSPFYKVQKETAGILRGTLADMGLTPESRGLAVETPDDIGELQF